MKSISRFALWLLVLSLLSVVDGNSGCADDDTPTSTTDSEAPAGDEQKADPFAVPDGTPRELFLFINQVKRERPPERTQEAVIAHLRKQVTAVMAAASAILAQEVSDSDALRAIDEQFVALSVLSRFDQGAQTKLISLAESLKKDPRPAVVRAADFQLLQQDLVKILSGAGEAEELSGLILGFIDQHGLDTQIVDMTSQVSQILGRSAPDAGGALLAELLPLLEKSEDPEILKRVPQIAGAARRMNLPGNFMELFGVTADGAEFDWKSYRGKYVLVDFWASWCGPCRQEIPNVKQNLAEYGDKGFTVVGVNIDRDRAEYDAYMEEAQLPWQNIMPDENGSSELATYYDITGIPTVILVDPQGVVISLNARGPELGRLLATHLGSASDSSGAE